MSPERLREKDLELETTNKKPIVNSAYNSKKPTKNIYSQIQNVFDMNNNDSEHYEYHNFQSNNYAQYNPPPASQHQISQPNSVDNLTIGQLREALLAIPSEFRAALIQDNYTNELTSHPLPARGINNRNMEHSNTQRKTYDEKPYSSEEEEIEEVRKYQSSQKEFNHSQEISRFSGVSGYFPPDEDRISKIDESQFEDEPYMSLNDKVSCKSKGTIEMKLGVDENDVSPSPIRRQPVRQTSLQRPTKSQQPLKAKDLLDKRSKSAPSSGMQKRSLDVASSIQTRILQNSNPKPTGNGNRQDILDWSKKQAWEKRVSSSYFGNSNVHDKARELSRSSSLSPIRSTIRPSNQRVPENNNINPLNANVENSLQYYRQRKGLSQQAENPMNKIPVSQQQPSKPNNLDIKSLSKGRTGVTKSNVPGSFFDFLKSKAGNPVDLKSKNEENFNSKPVSQNFNPIMPIVNVTNQTFKFNAAELSLKNKNLQQNVPTINYISKPTPQQLPISSNGFSTPKLTQTSSKPLFTPIQNTPGDMTDIAEWQRFTSWLTNIGMDQYIQQMKDHGVTKISILELLDKYELKQIGIHSDDIPLILDEIRAMTNRIRSFSEQAFSVLDLDVKQKQKPNNIQNFNKVPSNKSQTPMQSNISLASEAEISFEKPKEAEIVELPENIKDALLNSFDFGDHITFFKFWDSLQNHLSTILLNLEVPGFYQRPALLNAKQAIEFHLYIHFYVYHIKKSISTPSEKSREDVLLTKNSFRKYLENLSIQSELLGTTNNEIPISPLPPMSPCGMNSEEVAGTLSPENHDIYNSFTSTMQTSNQLIKLLTSSKEFAMYAGLVFVPNPQSNPAFQLLFKDEWMGALRIRLVQLIDVLVAESKESDRIEQSLPLKEASRVMHKPELTPAVSNIDIQQNENFLNNLGEKSNEDISNHSPLNIPQVTEIIATPITPILEADYHEDVTSPQSAASSISQLTDDTPLKQHYSNNSNGRLVPIQTLITTSATQKKATAPPTNINTLSNQNQTPPIFTFANNANISEVAAKAKAKLSQMQRGTPSPTHLHNNSSANPIPANPNKLSLQMQVDNYNKLLKQKRMNSGASPGLSSNEDVVQQPSIPPVIKPNTQQFANSFPLPVNVPKTAPIGNLLDQAARFKQLLQAKKDQKKASVDPSPVSQVQTTMISEPQSMNILSKTNTVFDNSETHESENNNLQEPQTSYEEEEPNHVISMEETNAVDAANQLDSSLSSDDNNYEAITSSLNEPTSQINDNHLNDDIEIVENSPLGDLQLTSINNQEPESYLVVNHEPIVVPMLSEELEDENDDAEEDLSLNQTTASGTSSSKKKKKKNKRKNKK